MIPSPLIGFSKIYQISPVGWTFSLKQNIESIDERYEQKKINRIDSITKMSSVIVTLGTYPEFHNDNNNHISFLDYIGFIQHGEFKYTLIRQKLKGRNQLVQKILFDL